MWFRNGLLLTDALLIKGHVNTGGQRLSTFLNNFPRRLLEIEAPVAADLVDQSNFTAARLLVRMDEIVLACELEEAGDEGLRQLAGQERDLVAVIIHFSHSVPFKLSGKASRRAIERDGFSPNDFLVVVEPRLLGCKSAALDSLESLTYLIVNKSRTALILDSE